MTATPPAPSPAVISPDTAAFLATGCALIVGAITPDGAPFAARGWGLDLLGGDPTSAERPPTVRLLLDLTDATTCASLLPGTPIAITATSVVTLRSVQLKGRVTDAGDATDDDRARAARYCQMFEDDVVATDGLDRLIFRRIIPPDYCARVVEVDAVFDQTPGPGAGARIEVPR